VTYNVTAAKPGFRNASAIIPAYGPTTVRLQVLPVQIEQEAPIIRYYDVEILVIDDRAEPIVGAIVEIYNADNQIVQSGTTGPDGTVRVRLPEGTYTVTVKADGYFEKTAVLSVPTATQLTISLDPTTRTKVMRYLPYFVMIALVLAMIGAFWVLKERIARRLSEEEEYF